MTNFTPTDEQRAIVAAARDTKDNLSITALAGAAKTSTLILIAEALPKVEILCLAFNKKTALELQERLPGNCRTSTLNALGHRIWTDMQGKRPNLYPGKMFGLVSDAVKTAPEGKSSFREILATAKEAKVAGYVPDEVLMGKPARKPSPLCDTATFYLNCEYDLNSEEQCLVDHIITESIEQAYAGIIDFDDQIYMPACFRAIFPLTQVVMVDEAQDLSALNHRFLTRLARRRLIVVGDPCQAIYGFRGAQAESMGELQEHFSMTPFPLCTSFRSPSMLVKHVQWRAPLMRPWSGNPYQGVIDTLIDYSLQDIPDGAVVICRNNAPLYRMAITFLQHGRPATLANGNLSKALVKLMGKLGPKSLHRAAALVEVDIWLERALRRSRAQVTLQDQAACMRVFIEQTETLGQALAYARDLALYEGAVELLTGHRAKGREWDTVYFLDEQLVGDQGQEPNIRYVICTRTKHELIYITSAGCTEMQEQE